MTATRLFERAVVCLYPQDPEEDVREFLQGLVTNDVTGNLPVYAALLSAQGKAMFDFFVCEGGDPGDTSIWLDCEAGHADELAKRLSLYRLRRKIDISVCCDCAVHWQANVPGDRVADPRMPQLGMRWFDTAKDTDEPADAAYLAHRLALGVPETHAELGDILWLETNAVELNGVSFEKGCYIGQENTARMNWRNKVNRRLVVVPLDDSNESRRKAAYPELGLAVDHLRVSDLDASALPDWQAAAITDASTD